MYGGFYRTKIKSVLQEPEHIFKMAGYDVDKDRHLLDLKSSVSKDTLLSIAFDCRIAASECRRIEHHYDKLKGLNKSLSDAIGDVLDDPSFSALASCQPASQNPSVPVLRVGGLGGLERQDVEINGVSSTQPESGTASSSFPSSPSGLSSSSTWKASNIPMPLTQLAPPDARLMTKAPHSYPMTKPPQSPLQYGGDDALRVRINSAPSSEMVNDQNLMCLANDSEFLPVLPELTSEDHMRASLKMIENQKLSQNISKSSSRSEPSSRNLSQLSTVESALPSRLTSGGSAMTYPPGYSLFRNRQTEYSSALIDDRLGNDSETRHQLQITPPLPNRKRMNYSSQSGLNMSNLHYRPHLSTTAGGVGNASSMSSHIIQIPPIDVDGGDDNKIDPVDLGISVRHGLVNTSSQRFPQSDILVPQVPPPIPPRELKPGFNRLSSSGIIQTAVNISDYRPDFQIVGIRPETVNSPHASNSNSPGGEGVTITLPRQGSVRPTTELLGHTRADSGANVNEKSFQAFVPCPEGTRSVIPPHTSSVMDRAGRVIVTGRSGSLKDGEGKKTPLTQLVAQSRPSSSMDLIYTKWRCQQCNTLNPMLSGVCRSCSHSQVDADNSSSDGCDSDKSCPTCTFINRSNMSKCEICGNKLPGSPYS